jgi:serralysin
MALSPLPSITQAMVVQQLDSGYHWFGPSISYSFPTTKLGLTGTTEQNSFSALNANQQSKAILALGLWDDLISTSFVAVTPGSSNIEFANTGLAGVYAQTYYPTDGTVWFSSAAIGADLITPVIGNHGFLTYIHELGHALGLNHMGDYNGAGANTPKSYQDSTMFSVMSYFGPSWGSGVGNGEGLVAWADWVGADNKLYEPQTPMLNDVYAIQQIYGADPSTRIGDTVYGFHSTVGVAAGGIFDFTSNLNPILCIYDSSGIDTLDLSSWSTSSKISLVPGTFSSGNSMTNNISIAYSCVIENAVGGAGNDVIYGNDFENLLSGGLGNDNIDGGVGNDVIIGGAGADTINGGPGYNTVDFVNSQEGVTVLLGYNYAAGGDAQGDKIYNCQAIIGSNAGDDVLFGDANVNLIYGNGGNDTISGGSGADTLDGGTGNNSLYYYNSAFGVTIYLNSNYAAGGEAQGDSFTNFQNVIGSNTGDDAIVGDSGYNAILGYGGNDTMGGGAGGDYLDGGAGNNSVWYYTSATGVTVYLGYNYATGGDATGDTILNFQNVYGSNLGNDLLVGDARSSTIYGFGGDDTIDGGAGIDYLDGGSGNNTIYYYNSALAVYVNLAVNGVGGGEAQSDTILNFQNIIGSNAGSDSLWGDAGSNRIFGYGGNDTIGGIGGNDYLAGGAGNDTFVFFAGNNGNDQIADFTIGQDHLQISNSLAANYGSLVLTQNGNNTIITLGVDSIQLDNIITTNLHAPDFIFF